MLIEWCAIHHTMYLFVLFLFIQTMWPLLFLCSWRWIELYLCIYGEDGTVHTVCTTDFLVLFISDVHLHSG